MAAPNSPSHDCSSFFSDEDDRDETRALQFQLQEVVFASLAMNTPRKSQPEALTAVEPETAAADKAESSMRFCEICTETKSVNHTFIVPNCGHGLCNDCVGKYVQAKVESNAHAILCPAVNCGEPIEYELCGSIFQLQEVVFASLAMNTPRKSQPETLTAVKPETAAADKAESSMRFCEICTEAKPVNLTFTVPNCRHGFCNDCVGKYVQAKVESNAHTIVCPAVNCGEPIEYELCGSILPRDVLEKWGELLCEASIGAAQKFYCPFKDCSEIMVRDPEEAIAQAECGACHRLFCARCNTAWHSDTGCEEFQRLGANERAREDLMLKSLAREKKWSQCPNCKFIVEKTEGCNHMVCRCLQFGSRCLQFGQHTNQRVRGVVDFADP